MSLDEINSIAMREFGLSFNPRRTEAKVGEIEKWARDMGTFAMRILGRSDELSDDFDNAAISFTSAVDWNIRNQSGYNEGMWNDAAYSVMYCKGETESWAGEVQEFKKKRNGLISDWETAVNTAENKRPKTSENALCVAPDGDLASRYDPVDRETFNEVLGELKGKLKELEETHKNNWDKFKEQAEEHGGRLKEGPTPENVARLVEGGHLGWAPFNLKGAEEPFPINPKDGAKDAKELDRYLGEDGEEPDEAYWEALLTLQLLANQGGAVHGDSKKQKEAMRYLEEFYAQLEKQAGSQGLPQYLAGVQDMDMSGEDQAESAQAFGDGILTLSNADYGGGWNKLPESVQNAVTGPTSGEDASSYTHQSWKVDLPALAYLMENAGPATEGGKGFSARMTSAVGGELQNDMSVVGMGEETAKSLLDVSFRNEDANHALLTDDKRFRHPEHTTEEVLEGLYTYRWSDEGETVRGLTDWISRDAMRDDPELRERAGEAAAGLIENITTPEMFEALTETGNYVTEGEDTYKNASFTQYNSEIADALTDVFENYIHSFAESPTFDRSTEVLGDIGVGDYDGETHRIDIGPYERLSFLQYLMGDDNSAARAVSLADQYTQIKADFYMEQGLAVEQGKEVGTLKGMVDAALHNEGENRSEDVEDQADREKEIANLAAGMVGDASATVPKIGYGLKMGIDHVSDDVIDKLIDDYVYEPARLGSFTGKNEVEAEVHAAGLESLVTDSKRDPDQVNIDKLDKKDLDALKEFGLISFGEDESGNISHISVERDQDKWHLGEHDEDFSAVREHLRNVMRDSELTFDDGRTEGAEQATNRYADQVYDQYGRIEKHFKYEDYEDFKNRNPANNG